MKRIYCKINGKLIPLDNLPCYKCDDRYSIHCPSCNWNKSGKHNTYTGIIVDDSHEENSKTKC